MTSGAGEGSEDGSEKNVKQENVDSANLSTEVRFINVFFCIQKRNLIKKSCMLNSFTHSECGILEIPEILRMIF